MPSPKIWLTFITQKDNYQNFVEIVEPIKDLIDGLVVTFHTSFWEDGLIADAEDEGLIYLKNNKGSGKIIFREFVNRHHVSMNETLYSGVIQNGDIVIVTDTLERPKRDFIQKLKGELIPAMIAQNIGCIYFCGKPFVFRYTELVEYAGSPHWDIKGVEGSSIEYNAIEPDETKVRQNVRPLRRQEKDGWIKHYAKYFLYPAGSNHALLGLENRGNPNELFGPREKMRLEFIEELRARGFPRTVDGVIEMLKAPLNNRLKYFLNNEKVWQDVYRHYVLGEEVNDNHHRKDMKTF